MTESTERLEFQIQVHERSLEQLRSFPPATTEEQQRDREKTIRWREEMLAELRAELAAQRSDSTAAPAPAAATRPTAPTATTHGRSTTTAASAAAQPVTPTIGLDTIVPSPAAGPLAAEIAAGERALASGRAAIVGHGARIERTRPARDFTAELAAAERALATGGAAVIGNGARTARAHVTRDLTAEYEAADRALAAGKAKIVKGGAASFPQPDPEPVETASRPLVERAKSRWDRDPALRAEFGYRFDMFLAYRRQAERQAARAGRR